MNDHQLSLQISAQLHSLQLNCESGYQFVGIRNHSIVCLGDGRFDTRITPLCECKYSFCFWSFSKKKNEKIYFFWTRFFFLKKFTSIYSIFWYLNDMMIELYSLICVFFFWNLKHLFFYLSNRSISWSI